MSAGLRWALVAGLVAVCAGYLVYAATGSSAEYYRTVSEVKAHPAAGDVRVLGTVQQGIERSNGGLDLRFQVAEGDASLPVVYHGTVPDIFQPGISVVVEGSMGSSSWWTFEAFRARGAIRNSTARL